MEYEEMIFCPLIDEKISIVDCMENRDIKDKYIPEKYKQKKNWKSICKDCKYQES